MKSQALPGFREFFPEDLALRSHIFDTWRRVATRYGFEEYDGPPLEPLELYTAKSGEEIVGQLYEFEDKGQRRVALRPEMTPTLARMVASRANGLKKPIRWFSIPQLFRYERQQRGRLREHFQLNCDLIGEPGPLADAEIIALAVDVLRALRLTDKDFRVRLSDRRITETWLSTKRVPLDVGYQRLDKWNRHPPRGGKQVSTELRNPIIRGVSDVRRAPEGAGIESVPSSETRLDDVLGELVFSTLADLEKTLGSHHAGVTSLQSIMETLDAMGLGDYVEFDPSIVRGLAYYTGTVFELFDAQGTLRAICGGGRYDNLVGELGGVDLPCVGFGMGDVVLGELLKDRGLMPGVPTTIDVFVAAIEGADLPHAHRLAHELREAGLRVEYALSPQPIAKQLRLADTRRARFAVVAASDERARGEVMLKDLGAKSQRPVRRDALIGELKGLMSND